MLKTYLPMNINSRQEAEDFLKELYHNNEYFDPSIPPRYWEDGMGNKLTHRECIRMSLLIVQIHFFKIDIAMFFRSLQMSEEANEWDDTGALEHSTPEMEILDNYEGREIKFVAFYVFEDLVILN